MEDRIKSERDNISISVFEISQRREMNNDHNMSHSQMLGKVESGGGPIFKVVLEC